MRILHITKRYPPYVGGIETVCYDMAEALAGEHEQLVLAFNDQNETVDEIYHGIHVIRAGVQRVIASQPLSRDYRSLLDKAFREFKPEVIHFDYPNPYASHYLLKAMKRHKFSGLFYLFWHMDVVKQKLLRMLFVPQTKKLLARADRIIATSPNYLVGTSFLPKVDPKRIDIIPLCVGEDRMVVTEENKKQAEAIKAKYPRKKLVFFFGRHVPYKGLGSLIEANKYPGMEQTELLIGGKGPLTEELKAKAANMPNVHFLGRLEDEEINSYLLACDIFAFPSITRNEAFGISLAEALYFGKPAVTFTIDGSGVNFVSVHNESGLEAPNGDAEQLAKNIVSLCEDKELYARLSEGASARAHRLFGCDTFSKAIRAAFSEKQ